MVLEGAISDKKFFAVDFPELVPKAYAALGLTHNRRNHGDEAIQALEKAVELKFDKNPLVYQVLGFRYYQKGEKEKSLKAMQRALVLNPKDADSYLNIAYPFKDLGQRDNAILALKTFLSLTKRPKGDPAVKEAERLLAAW